MPLRVVPPALLAALALLAACDRHDEPSPPKRIHFIRDPQAKVDGGGTASLAMVLAFHGVKPPLEDLRAEIARPDGTTDALQMLKAARRHTLDGRGLRLDHAGVLAGIATPYLLHLKDSYFVVVGDVSTSHADILHPVTGKQHLTLDELWQRSDGMALEIFEPSK
jgi:ABC-type bacteriocin/lantibiotic exporter with double-glycine peptidase domain